MLWRGRHGWAGSSRFGAPIASHLPNAPLRANAANGVTGSDQATLLESGPCRPQQEVEPGRWAMPAPPPPPPANIPPPTPASVAPPASAKVTVALEAAAGGRWAHQRCPGRPGGLGHPAAPILTAAPDPRLRSGDRPDPAGTEIGVDGPDRAAGAHHRPQPPNPPRSHRAGGPQ